MKLEVLANAEEVAQRGATLIAQEARKAVDARGWFLLATSGGATPWRMWELLAVEDMPWPRVHVFQVDERIAAASDADRNLAQLQSSLLARVRIPPDQVHAMPVEEVDLAAAAVRYAALLRRFAGTPPVLDLIHLGLGSDGHTASLISNDPALDPGSAEVAVTGSYQGFRRMTLTLPVLERARRILWIVTGSGKAAALGRLRSGDRGIPAGRVPTEHALLLADAAAMGS